MNDELRDEFAKSAMVGFMDSTWNVNSFEQIATKSYELADEMMLARRVNKPTVPAGVCPFTEGMSMGLEQAKAAGII
tara:strand:- start:2540 stop:2770 length:231 start_codon:yes stop_codon:yes gene_type:complete